MIAEYGPDGAPDPILFTTGLSLEFSDALADESALELAYVLISVEDPPAKEVESDDLWPWDDAEDVKEYVDEVWPEDLHSPAIIASVRSK